MSTEIVYSGFDNKDQAARIQELMESVRPLFPHDINRISVLHYAQVGPGDNSANLKINIGYTEYLFVELEVYHAFFDVPRAKQRVKIIHEIVHALQAKVLMFDRDSLIDYVKAHNPDLGAYLFREHTERVETFTQHMAFGIEAMIRDTEIRVTKSLTGQM